MRPSSARRFGIRARESLSEASFQRLGGLIQRRAFWRVRSLRVRFAYCYAAVRREVPTQRLIAALLSVGCRVALPRVEYGSDAMELLEIGSLSELEPGRWGVPSPPRSGRRVSLPELDLALVPCASADRFGNRAGMGGGYHDRFFASADRPPLIGLAFERQRVERIEAASWDVPLDELATELGCVRFCRRGAQMYAAK